MRHHLRPPQNPESELDQPKSEPKESRARVESLGLFGTNSRADRAKSSFGPSSV